MRKALITSMLIFICAAAAGAQTDGAAAGTSDSDASSRTVGRKAAAAHNWSGFYVGGNAFGSRDAVEADNSSILVTQISNLQVNGRGLVVVPGTTAPGAPNRSETNWSGGGQAGYLWQRNKAVFGIEGGFDPFGRTTTLSQSQQLPPTALTPATTITYRRDYKESQEVSILGRVGYASGDNLFYGTGGYANARVRVTTIGTFTNPGGLAASCAPAPCQANLGPEGPVVSTFTGQQRKGGWAFGGGFDHMFSRHYSLGVEYRHTQISVNSFTAGSGSTVNTGPETHGDNGATGTLGMVSIPVTNFKLRSDAVSLRFNIHF
jgi:outer membrane immunogenic protein